jgi:SAM-dependent methyltransferase
MTTAILRPPWQGVARIVRFNWPMYAAGVGAALGAAALPVLWPLGPAVDAVAQAAAGLAAFWVAASLAASWLVYDRSALTTAGWVSGALGTTPRSWVAIDAGFDGMTAALRRALAGSQGRALDIYDPALMTESSIARARRAEASASEQVSHRRLPLPDASVDAALLLLSAHELRTHQSRRALFDEIGRVLAPDGRVVVAEHLRDLPNFVAFGPGFLHFHSRPAWLRCFTQSNFSICREMSITPFVRVFVLTRAS